MTRSAAASTISSQFILSWSSYSPRVPLVVPRATRQHNIAVPHEPTSVPTGALMMAAISRYDNRRLLASSRVHRKRCQVPDCLGIQFLQLSVSRVSGPRHNGNGLDLSAPVLIQTQQHARASIFDDRQGKG
jgi:hypothetical protein